MKHFQKLEDSSLSYMSSKVESEVYIHLLCMSCCNVRHKPATRKLSGSWRRLAVNPAQSSRLHEACGAHPSYGLQEGDPGVVVSIIWPSSSGGRSSIWVSKTYMSPIMSYPSSVVRWMNSPSCSKMSRMACYTFKLSCLRRLLHS